MVEDGIPIGEPAAIDALTDSGRALLVVEMLRAVERLTLFVTGLTKD